MHRVYIQPKESEKREKDVSIRGKGLTEFRAYSNIGLCEPYKWAAVVYCMPRLCRPASLLSTQACTWVRWMVERNALFNYSQKMILLIAVWLQFFDFQSLFSHQHKKLYSSAAFVSQTKWGKRLYPVYPATSRTFRCTIPLLLVVHVFSANKRTWLEFEEGMGLYCKCLRGR